jgi:hypothetical protein
MTEFHDLVGDDLGPEEEARLRGVHELLMAAGPPPELPPELEELPAKGRRAPRAWPQFPLLPPRRVAAGVVLALGCVAAAFGIGVLVGDGGNGFGPARTVGMHSAAGAPSAAVASIDVASPDEAGNWPILLRVRGLPTQPPGGHYELWLTRNGKPVALCGPFRVQGGKTVVQMNAPYRLKKFDGWIVTTDDRTRVLLTT